MPKAGSRQQRGYGAEHDRVKKAMRPYVEAGLTHCWRCGRRIKPGQPWDVGHDDRDRCIVRGPEHADCNRRAGALRRHGKNAPEPHPNVRR